MAPISYTNMPTILLTGATGYIASHTWLELLAAGYDVVGLDDFSNSSPEVLNRLEQLSGRPPEFERASVCDADALHAVFARHRIDAVGPLCRVPRPWASRRNSPCATTPTTSAAC